MSELSVKRSTQESETGGKASEGDCVHGNKARGPAAALGRRPEEAGRLMEPTAAPGEAESRCPGWHLAQTLRPLPCSPLIALGVAALAHGLLAGSWASAGMGSALAGQPSALWAREVPGTMGWFLDGDAPRSPSGQRSHAAGCG